MTTTTNPAVLSCYQRFIAERVIREVISDLDADLFDSSILFDAAAAMLRHALIRDGADGVELADLEEQAHQVARDAATITAEAMRADRARAPHDPAVYVPDPTDVITERGYNWFVVTNGMEA